MDLLLIGVGVIVLIIVIIFVLIFNRLIVLRNRVNNAWAQIDVQLKKRNDLVPNLIETVKGYAKHERTVFQKVTEARTAIMKAKTVTAKAKASDLLTSALKSLFAVAENYPKLEASKNFMMLQEELSGIESKIAYARQFYNDSVLNFNNTIQVFPNSIVAGIFNFKRRDYFEIKEAERAPVKVKFE